MKLCCKCKHEKPLSEFNTDRHAKDGKHYACRQCQREYQCRQTAKKSAKRSDPEDWVDPKAKFVKRNCLCCGHQFRTANNYRMCRECRNGDLTRGYDDFYAEAA